MYKPRSLAAALAMAAAVLAASSCRESPTQAIPDPGPVILLGDGATEDSVAAILTSAGIEVHYAGPYWEFDGSGLEEASAVILLTGYDYFQDMPHDVQHGIVAFVAAGGGLMTTEWMLYNYHYEADKQDIIAAIAPAIYGEDYEYEAEQYTRMAAGHPVAQGLPATFMTRDDWTAVVTLVDPSPAKQAQVIFSGSTSGAAVIAGVHGQGRTVHWSMAGQYDGDDIWSDEVRQLLVNIASYISGRS